MKKFLLLAVVAVFSTATVAAFGQNTTPPALKRSGFSKLTLGEERFSFRNANRFIDDPAVVHRLETGLRMEKAAIGLGIGGAGVMAGG